MKDEKMGTFKKKRELHHFGTIPKLFHSLSNFILPGEKCRIPFFFEGA
jgi:hypothetical protein